MLQVRKSEERGNANHGWLQSKHTFSFDDYRDPEHTGFGPLLVINEDRVAPGQGFGTHGHRDMEIISYVLEGALEHSDSMGTGSVLHYGDVQRMSAGAGVRHSEFNGSKTEPVHFLQIWIEPNVRGIAPSYEEKRYAPESKQGQLRLIASSDGRDGSVRIHQDAAIYGLQWINVNGSWTDWSTPVCYYNTDPLYDVQVGGPSSYPEWIGVSVQLPYCPNG